jgi:ABC-2 type transport system permease protein
MPSLGPDGLSSFRPEKSGENVTAPAVEDLGLIVQGRFDSFFAGKSHPLNNTGQDPQMYTGPGITSLVQHSPESARIVLYASNDFMDDQILNAVVTASGTQYLGPLELFMNTLDWALQDDQLLQIRSRAHFNRTLPPMERHAQALIEYINYGLAVLWLVLLAVAHWLRKILRRRRYSKGLAL